MASIRTGIELQDNFSPVLEGIMVSVSEAVNGMQQMQHTMNAGVDTSAITDAVDDIDSATAAARELTEALQNIHAPIVNLDQPSVPRTEPSYQQDVPPQRLANPPPTVNAVVTDQPEINVPDDITVPVTAEVTQQPVIDTPEPITVPVTPEITDTPDIAYSDITVPVTPVVTGQAEIDTPDPIEVPVTPVITDQPQLNTPEPVTVPVTAEVTDTPDIEVPDELTVPVTPIVTDQPEINVPDDITVPVTAEVTQQPVIDTPEPITVPVTPEITDTPELNIPEVEIPQPDVSGVQQYANLINLVDNALQKIVDVQNRINTQSAGIDVLPDDTQSKITEVNAKIQQMQAALNYLRDNPMNLDAEATLLQIQRLNTSIDQTLQAQKELDTALQGMDMPDISPVDIPVNVDIPEPLVDPDQPPIIIPIQWEGWKSGADVFTSTGVERFQSEVQAANKALNTLNRTQQQIEQNAAQLEILPNSAMQDITSLGQRLTWITERIQVIESNPLNLGTDEANAELEQLRSQLDAALHAQDDLNAALQDMDVSAANNAYLRLSQTIGNTERYIRDNIDEQGQFNQAIQEGASQADKLTDTIKGVVAAYVSIQSVGKALDISDQLTLTTSRLDMMNDGIQDTSDLVKMVYAAAQDARGSFSDMADVVARFGNNAKDAFSSSAEVVAFADLVQKQMTIAGASTQEASDAMLQLSQALGSGVLRGDELNSIFEQSPNLIQTIADYLDVPIGQIREMAADGELSAGVVKAAIFAAADDINAKFESMPMTWNQIWTSFQNTALMAFQPILQRLNQIANSDAFQGFVNSAINAMASVANIILNIFDLVGQIGTFVANHWSVIGPIVYGVVGALAVYAAYLAVIKAIEIASAAATTIHAVAMSAKIGITAALTNSTMAATAAQMGYNGALYACPLVWIIVLIVALIALFYAAVGAINELAGTSISATGIIAGTFATLGALIYNVFALVWNIIAAVVEFLVNVWTDPEYAAKAFVVNVGQAFINFALSLVTGMQSAVGLIVGLFYAFGQGAQNVFAEIVNFGIDAIVAIVNGWNSGVYEVKSAIVELGTMFLDFLINCIQNNASAIGTFIGVWYVFQAAAYNVIAFIVNAFIDFVTAIVNLWQDGTYEIKSAFVAIGTLVLKVAQSILSTMGGLVSGVINGIIGGVNAALSGLNSVIDTVNMIPGVSISHIGEMNEVNLDFGASKLQGVESDLQEWLGDEPETWEAPWDKWETKDLSDAYAEGQAKADELISNSVDALENAKSELQEWLGDEPETWEAPWDKWETKDINEAFKEGQNIGADAVSNLENWLNNASNSMNEWLGEKPENYWEAPTMDYINLSDAAKAGYEFGQGVEDKISSGFDSSTLLDGIPDVDFSNISNGIADGITDSGIGDGVGNIADNTADIKDALDVTNEDLKYLRDIAEQETINRYTTAEIHIEQTNNNNINSDMDLDGIVDGLTDAVNEAVDEITEGVHG